MQVFIAEITLNDQHPVHHAGAKVQIDPSKGRLTFAQQVRLRLRRAAHAVIAQLRKRRDELPRVWTAVSHTLLRARNWPALRESRQPRMRPFAPLLSRSFVAWRPGSVHLLVL